MNASITSPSWERARARGYPELARRYEDEWEAAVQHAAVLRRILDGV